MEKKTTFSEIWKEAKALCKKNYWKVVPFMFFIFLMSMTSAIPVSVFGGSAMIKNALDMIISLILGPILSLSAVYAMIRGTSIKESFGYVLKNWKGAIKTTYLVAGIIYSFVAILVVELVFGVVFAVISNKIPVLGGIGIALAVLAGIVTFVFMIIVSFRYAFAIYLWIDKKIEGFKALAASRELTKGNIGRIIGYVCLLYLIFVPVVLLGVAIAVIAGLMVGSKVLTAVLVGLVFMSFILFVAPFAIAFMVSLYKGILSFNENNLSEAKTKSLEKFAAVFGLIIFILLMMVSIFIPDNSQKEDKFSKTGELRPLLEETNKIDGFMDQNNAQNIQNQQITNP